MTVTTNQIAGIGLVGIVIIVVATVLVVKLVKGLVGRIVWTVVALGLLAGVYQQRTAVEHSIKACEPAVFGLHLQISDPAQRARCLQIVNGKNT